MQNSVIKEFLNDILLNWYRDIKKGFEGEIPAGTPIVQVIPFKREEWEAKSTKGLWDIADATVKASIPELLNGHYRKNFWKKKVYK